MALRFSDEESDKIGLERDPIMPVSQLYIAGKDEVPSAPVLRDDGTAFFADVSFGDGVLLAVSCSTPRNELEQSISESTREKFDEEDSGVEWDEVAAFVDEDGSSIASTLTTQIQEYYSENFGAALQRYAAAVLPQIIWARHGSERLRKNKRNGIVSLSITTAAFGFEVTQNQPSFGLTALTGMVCLAASVFDSRRSLQHFDKVKHTAARSALVGVVATQQIRSLFSIEDTE